MKMYSHLFLSCIAVALLSQAAGQCPSRDRAYLPDPGQCDAYTECILGAGYDRLCPDGLVFNDKLPYLRFPCDYPVHVDCGTRTKLQPPQPSGNCPRQFGLFRKGSDPSQCGQYYNCVGGREYLLDCPEGLAFSAATYRCEWPDEAVDCDPEAYLGFQCPTPPTGSVVDTRHANPNDCGSYFLCVGGVTPRLLQCDNRQVYNPETESCDHQANVPGCERTFITNLRGPPARY